MNKNASIRKVGEVTIIELKGKITIGAGDLQMREAIHAALAEGARKLVVDMSQVSTSTHPASASSSAASRRPRTRAPR
jgi:hypothetical protein